MDDKKTHYGVEYGDLREFGLGDTRKFVNLSCRQYANCLIENFNFTQDKSKVTCKKCLRRINQCEDKEE